MGKVVSHTNHLKLGNRAIETRAADCNVIKLSDGTNPRANAVRPYKMLVIAGLTRNPLR